MIEEWRSVVGFEGFYEVSDLGNVRSIRNNHGNPRCRPCKSSLTHDGYHRHSLSKTTPLGVVKAKKKVAHLVLEAFVGARPDGLQACHCNSVSTDDRLCNLRWDTPRSNYDDLVAHGSHKGERHHMVTISEETARKVKEAAKDLTRLAQDIADEFGTTVHIVRNIRNNNSWRWL